VYVRSNQSQGGQILCASEFSDPYQADIESHKQFRDKYFPHVALTLFLTPATSLEFVCFLKSSVVFILHLQDVQGYMTPT
jgi:hypothetical protein